MKLLFLIIVLSIFVFVLIFLRINRAKIIGKEGEKKVSLRLHLLPTEYYLLNDVYLNIQGNSVQIDHIIVSKYGIFVIETKNYKGLIFGTDKSEYWTKNMYGKKYTFRNPLKQNYYHVKCLQSLLNIPQSKFVPIVVFLKGAILRCKTLGVVVSSNKLLKEIRSHKTLVFTQDEVQHIIFVLTESSIKDRRNQKKHIDAIKQKKAVRDEKIKLGICPRCNGNLVGREGKYGKFFGCSNYPRCTYTIKK